MPLLYHPSATTSAFYEDYDTTWTSTTASTWSLSDSLTSSWTWSEARHTWRRVIHLDPLAAPGRGPTVITSPRASIAMARMEARMEAQEKAKALLVRLLDAAQR